MQSTWSRFKTYSGYSVASLGKTLYGTFRCCWCWPAVLNFSHNFIKHLKKKRISARWQCPEAGRCNCLTVALCIAPTRFPASQEDKYKDEIKNKSSCLRALTKVGLEKIKITSNEVKFVAPALGHFTSEWRKKLDEVEAECFCSLSFTKMEEKVGLSLSKIYVD